MLQRVLTTCVFTLIIVNTPCLAQRQWIRQNSGTSSDLNAVFFTDANTGTAVGLGGTILRTTDGGQTWTRQVSGTLVTLNGVHFIDGNTGTAVGLDGDIFRTTNGGQTWTFQDGGTSSHLNDVFFTDVNTGTAVGLGGTILRTINGGQTWTRQVSGTTVTLNGVSFTDVNTGTAVGLDGDIFRTTNGGQTWVFQDGGTSSHLNDVFFPSTNTGTAVGLAGTILRTTNGGQSWVRQTSNTPVALNGVHFIDDNTGTTVGLDGDIFRTIDGGQTWIFEDGGTSSHLNDVFFTDANTGTAVGSGGVILRTASCTFAISPVSATVGAAASRGQITVTATAGCSWNAVSTVNWITIDAGSPAIDNGVVDYSFAANSGAQRTGTIAIAGQTFTLTQNTAPNRAPIVANTIPNQTITVGGQAFSLDLAAQPAVFQDPDGDPLTYSVSSANTAVATATVNGSMLTVAPVAAGTATITVVARDPSQASAQTSFVVTVRAATCNYAIAPANASFNVDGGTGRVNVTADAGCAWTATSGATWITITSGASGTGNGTVDYSVTANSGSSRTGTLTIAGHTFTVTQSSTSNSTPTVANPILDQMLTVPGQPFSIDLEAQPAVFNDPDGDALTYDAWASNTAVASVTLNGSVLTVTPLAEGTTTINVVAMDPFEEMAETSFQVTVTVGCWLVDSFENLSPGSLNGRNGWFTGAARSDATVVVNPSGPGHVLLMDAGPGETVNMGKDVADQTAGTHSVKVRVLVDGPVDPAIPTLAKIEVRTVGNPTWDKKFQLYFGAHMRLNFGPSEDSALVFLPEHELVTGRWYEIEAVIDLATNLVDVFVDGVTRLTNIAAGSGPITDISISAWDRPGRVFYDDLRFCPTADRTPTNACSASSTFDFSTEGWTVIGDAQSGSVIPDYHSTGGNPDGYVSARDDVTGARWYWQAPRTFHGDASCAYGQSLEFDLQQSNTTSQFDAEDIVLEGNGLMLVFDTPCNPGLCDQGSDWTHYSIPLTETAGWRKDDGLDKVMTGDPPTREEMQGVLSSLTRLLIRGEYRSGSDIGGLDNVAFKVPAREMQVTASPGSHTVTAGESVDYVVVINPVAGVLEQDVTFGCSGLPAHSSCDFAPAVVRPGRRSASTTMTIVTTDASASATHKPMAFEIPRGTLVWGQVAGAIALIIVIVATSRSRRVRRLAWSVPVMLLTALLPFGCNVEEGVITEPPSEAESTPAGTFTITVTATTEGLEQTAEVTLVVE